MASQEAHYGDSQDPVPPESPTVGRWSSSAGPPQRIMMNEAMMNEAMMNEATMNEPMSWDVDME